MAKRLLPELTRSELEPKTFASVEARDFAMKTMKTGVGASADKHFSSISMEQWHAQLLTLRAAGKLEHSQFITKKLAQQFVKERISAERDKRSSANR